MIFIYYTFNNKEWSKDLTQIMLNDFSEEDKKKWTGIFRWRERQAKILGRKLLAYGLDDLKLTPGKIIINFNVYQKPFLQVGPFFNITHSGDYVVCAISEEMEIGIDIEKKRKKRLPDIPSAFTDKENEIIKKYPDKLYDFWTKKEAIVKAEGSGLLHKMNTIETCEDLACLKENYYATKNILIDPEYICHVAYRL